MSDTMSSAIVGAVVGGILTGLATYVIAWTQWKKEQKAQRSMLLDSILSDLADSLNRAAVKYADNEDYIQELETKSAKAIRFLSLKGQVEKKEHWRKAAVELHRLMGEYFHLFDRYRRGQVTLDDIEAYRNNIKNQVGDILGKALLS